jgi:DNA-binding NarL/FixJ family response regulator
VIRLVVADDHSVVRAGLEQLVTTFEGVELVGSAADGAAAVALCVDLRPDVALMDLEMPELDGIQATERIVADAPETKVVVLTSFSDRERILSALDAGAAGYILKDATPDEVLDAVRAAARGESPLDPKAGSALLAERRTPASAGLLSDREREVLAMVAEGMPNKLISRELEISEKTVKAHLTSVFRRIGVTDRTQAAIWAREHRIARETES